MYCIGSGVLSAACTAADRPSEMRHGCCSRRKNIHNNIPFIHAAAHVIVAAAVWQENFYIFLATVSLESYKCAHLVDILAGLVLKFHNNNIMFNMNVKPLSCTSIRRYFELTTGSCSNLEFIKQ